MDPLTQGMLGAALTAINTDKWEWPQQGSRCPRWRLGDGRWNGCGLGRADLLEY